jgi:predicted phage terminase large subunit-like protein
MTIQRSVDNELTTTKRGFRKSTSVSGTLTGLGADLFIIDDPQKPADAYSEIRRDSLNQWFANTLVSRLDNKQTSAIIVVMQRVHLGDLSGYLSNSPEDWEILNLPAIADADVEIPVGPNENYHRSAGEALHPALESIETLQKLRRSLGPDVFAAQYQQAPVPEGGAMIKREWLRCYDKLPKRTSDMKVIQSWDTAAKDGSQNAWSVCTTWLIDDEKYYLIGLTRGRYDYPSLRDVAIELATKHEPDEILIEDASTGIALAQELGRKRNFNVTPIKVEGDKKGRLYVQQAKFEAGQVLFPRHASFLADLEAELLTFPQGQTDDQVDSISQALAWEPLGYDTSMKWV